MRPSVGTKAVRDWATDYQCQMLDTLGHRSSLLLKWAGGAGKTFAAIMWARATQYTRNRVLIVCPANVKAQWAAAVQRFTDERPLLVYGTIGKAFDANIVIVNWELLSDRKADCIAFLQAQSQATLILDESHRMLSWKRTRKVLDAAGNVTRENLDTTATAAAVIARAASRCIALTATPYSKSIADLWSQLDALEPGCWGSSYEFAQRYCAARKNSFGGLDTSGRSNTDELRKRLTEIMHVVSRQQMEAALPGKIREVIKVLAEQQTNVQGESGYLKRAAKEGKESLLTARVALAAARKRPWLTEYATDLALSGQKVLILTGRREDVETLGRALSVKLKNSDVELWFSHGGTPAAEREKQRLAYAERDTHAILIGTHEAWGESVDGLQNTDVAIMAMLPWTVRRLIQSEARVSRQGQDRRVRIVFPVCENTVDERIADTLLNRLETVALVLDGEEDSAAAAEALTATDTRLLDDLLADITRLDSSLFQGEDD